MKRRFKLHSHYVHNERLSLIPYDLNMLVMLLACGGSCSYIFGWYGGGMGSERIFSSDNT